MGGLKVPVDARPEPIWLVQCRLRKRGAQWTLVVVPQAAPNICPHCLTNIFIKKNPVADHRE